MDSSRVEIWDNIWIETVQKNVPFPMAVYKTLMETGDYSTATALEASRVMPMPTERGRLVRCPLPVDELAIVRCLEGEQATIDQQSEYQDD